MADLPLAGKHIVVTRARDQAGPLKERLEALGASVSVVPLIQIDPIEDRDVLKASMRDLHRYDWLVVTSVNGVRFLAGWEGFQWLRRNVRFAAVGPVTADALRRLGIEPDFVPEQFAADAIAAGLSPVRGARVLLVQGLRADPMLAQGLQARGAIVSEYHLYQAVDAEAAEAERASLRAADAVVLMSGSAARSLATQGGAGSALVVCIGPKTADAARAAGLEVGLVAREASSEGIIHALTSHFGEKE